MSERVVVLVVGGGPSGATAAALLAREGVEVVLLERSRFPRYFIGESLQPAALQLLDEQLGLGPALAAEGFARKYGAVYVWGDTREPWSVLFDERLEQALPETEEELLDGGYEFAWQVERKDFDVILLNEARRRGVDVRDETEALGPIVEDGRVVGVSTAAGEIRADLVLDASGQARFLGRALGLSEPLSGLPEGSTWAYYEGAGGVPGVLGRHVQLVVSVRDGWVWFIPIRPDLTSIGVVVRGREQLDEAAFEAMLAEAKLPLEGATRGELMHTSGWSHSCRRLAGPGFALLGDAGCFVDPVLSGGVDFAIRGGANGAMATLRVLAGADPREEFTAYEQRVRKEAAAYTRLVRYWYGNNRSVEGFFWEAHQELQASSLSTPLRAFVYLTSGRFAADHTFRVFVEWQEKKMFEQLGVDKAALRRAWAERG